MIRSKIAGLEMWVFMNLVKMDVGVVLGVFKTTRDLIAHWAEPHFPCCSKLQMLFITSPSSL